MEVLAVIAIALAFYLGTRSGRSSALTEIQFLRDSAKTTEQRYAKAQEVNTSLINTILMMRQEGKTAPPIDDSWGVYTMGDEED